MNWKMMNAANLHTDLRLEADGEGFKAELPAHWMINGSAFGGFTTGLALLAAAGKANLPIILSCHTMFLGILKTGSVSLDVEILSQGRSSSAVRVVMRQDGQTRLSIQAWLATKLAAAGSARAGDPPPPPDACVPINFRAPVVPCMRVLDERAIDYPDSFDGFMQGPPLVDLWMRPSDPEPGSTLRSQIFDVIAFDAHMLDSPRRMRPTNRGETASVDMAVEWYAGVAFPAWRRVRIESGPLHDGFVATSGTLRDAAGGLCARCMQVGRYWPPR